MTRQPNELKKRSGADLARQRLLQDHERAIGNALKSFIELGKHLGAISRDKLYQDAGFERFEDYVESRFDMSRQHAYRIIEAARAALTVSPIGDKIRSISAARELVPLSSDPAKMQAVFDEAVRRAGDGRLTAALVREVREEMFPGVPTIEGEWDETPPIAPGGDPLDSFPAAKQAVEERLHQTSPGSAPPVDGEEGAANQSGTAASSEPPKDSPADQPPVPDVPEEPSDLVRAGDAGGQPEQDHRDALGEADGADMPSSAPPADAAAGDETAVEAPTFAPVDGREQRGGAGVSGPAALVPKREETEADQKRREDREMRERLTLAFSEGLVAVAMRLDPDPIAWFEEVYLRGVYKLRDMPRVSDCFTPDGIRASADRLYKLANYLDETGTEL